MGTKLSNLSLHGNHQIAHASAVSQCTRPPDDQKMSIYTLTGRMSWQKGCILPLHMSPEMLASHAIVHP